MTVRQTVRWYDRERMPYTADRVMIDHYANYFKTMPWQLFGTFTFAWKVSDAQAHKTFTEFISRLERKYGCVIGYLRGDEKQASGCGKPASARHFHAMLAATAKLDAEEVEAMWMQMAGNRKDHGGAHVLLYDASLKGVAYVLKKSLRADGDWHFDKLNLFERPEDTAATPHRAIDCAKRGTQSHTTAALFPKGVREEI